jgi:hypothetical protein
MTTDVRTSNPTLPLPCMWQHSAGPVRVPSLLNLFQSEFQYYLTGPTTRRHIVNSKTDNSIAGGSKDTMEEEIDYLKLDIGLPSGRKLLLWRWALLQRPLDTFPTFYGTRKFITAFTTALHLSLSWARTIQSTSPHPTSPRSILILFANPPSWSSQRSLSFWLSHQQPIHVPLLPNSCYMPCPPHPSWLDHSNYTWRRVCH